MDRSLAALEYHTQQMAHRWHAECERRGLTVLVYCTYRTPLEQAALYAQGRRSLEGTNAIRMAAGMAPIDTRQNGRKVTYAKPMYSWHNWRRALDFVIVDGGKPEWRGDHPGYAVVGKIGESEGLEWSGRWRRFREVGHLQYTGGLSIKELIDGQNETPYTAIN